MRTNEALTDTSLQAAMKKAVEVGLVPKYMAGEESYVAAWRNVEAVLVAALASAPPAAEPFGWVYESAGGCRLFHKAGDCHDAGLAADREAAELYPTGHRLTAVYAAPQPAEPAPQQGEADTVSVPRSLIGAACAAIRLKHDAPTVVEKLRRYTTGDLSHSAQPAEPAQPATQAGAGETTREQAQAVAVWLHANRHAWEGVGVSDVLEVWKKLTEQMGAAQPTEQPSQDANPPR